jgi:WD40 repeat protein
MKYIREVGQLMIVGVLFGCSPLATAAADTPTPSFTPAASNTPTAAPTFTSTPDPFLLTPQNAVELTFADKAIGAFIRSMAWSPDGRYIAVAFGSDIHLFDAENFKEVRVLGSPGPDLLAFSPDGKRIYSSAIHLVESVDVETGDQVAKYLQGEGPDNGVVSIAVHPEGNLLALGDRKGSVFVVDADTSRTMLSLGGFGEMVRGLAFSPDGKLLAAADNDGMVLIWDLKTGEEVVKIDEHPYINQVSFTPDGDALAVGFGRIHFWSLSGELLQEYSDYSDVFAFNRQGTLLATGGRGFIRLWDVKTHAQLSVLSQTRGNPVIGYIHGLTFSSDGKYLAAASSDGSLKMWGLPGSHSAAGDDFMLTDRLPDGQYVVTSTFSGVCGFRAIDIADGTEWPLTDNVCLQDLSVFANGTKLAFLGPHSDSYRVLDLATNAFTDIDVYEEYTAVNWSPDGIHIASRCMAQDHCIVTIEDGLAYSSTGWDSSSVPVWSPDGKWMAFFVFLSDPSTIPSGPSEGAEVDLRVTDASCLETPATCPEATRTVLSMKTREELSFAWSPDNRFLAVSKEMGDGIYIVDVAKGRVQNTIPTPDIREENIAWSPDGEWILYAVYPGVIYRVSPESGEAEIVAEDTGHVYFTINIQR